MLEEIGVWNEINLICFTLARYISTTDPRIYVYEPEDWCLRAAEPFRQPEHLYVYVIQELSGI